jgi:hypothetical protein
MGEGNRRLGLAHGAKPNLRPNPVSQLFMCVCLSTPIPPGFFLVHSVIEEIAEMNG